MTEYPVAWGDSLWEIAWRYGVPGGYEAIAEANDIANPHWILAGDRLRIPGLVPGTLSAWPVEQPVPTSLKSCDVDVTEALHLTSSLPPTCELRVVEAQLDQDRDLERLIGCKVDDNDYEMSTWQVVLVDGPRETEPFELAVFGEGSVVEGPMGCELLATRWVEAPLGMSTSWHLTGRRMRLVDGQLSFSSDELRSRRLLLSFDVSTPEQDLSDRDARVRSIEPMLQGVHMPPYQAPWGARYDELGDSRTGLLYPKSYLPPNPPATVDIQAIRVGAWEQITVAWI
ncbi:MAG TPA: LysM domain-containing protein [Myxococcota bacterium]|nr:LysM domain-containing protein [Myxococcota bacterium]